MLLKAKYGMGYTPTDYSISPFDDVSNEYGDFPEDYIMEIDIWAILNAA